MSKASAKYNGMENVSEYDRAVNGAPRIPARITRREESFADAAGGVGRAPRPIADLTSFSSSGGGSTAGMPSDASKHQGRDTPVEREKSRAT
jgi:hypothetical protein